MTKLRFWDRILSAVMGVLCIALAAAILLYVIGILPLQPIKDVIATVTTGGWMYWAIFGVVLLLLVLLGIHGIGLLFRRRKDKGFVVQHTEFGDMSISMKAMENMVKKCADAHGELTVNNTKIYLVRGGVSIDMKITLASGVNIPLTVNALQKQIKQYITSCSGVDVHEVRVKVETDAVKLLPPPSAPVIEPPAAEMPKPVETPAEKPCQYKEEPTHYAAEPETEPAAAESVCEAGEAALDRPEEKPAEETATETAVEETAEAGVESTSEEKDEKPGEVTADA